MDEMFGDLNDCYGRALQEELAEANRLEQEMIEAGYRETELHYQHEDRDDNFVNCGVGAFQRLER